MRKRLTPRQQKFVQETIKTLNPTEAVRRTYNLGSKGGKKLENTARSIASENLTKPNIKEAIQKALSTIDPAKIIKKFNELVDQTEDKRTSLGANKELAKLLDMYPKEQTEIESGEVKVIIKKRE